MINSPTITVEITGKHERIRTGAVVDTGFTGGVAIPLETALKLGLDKVGEGVVELADGSEQAMDIFSVDIEINGVKRKTTALVMGDDILVGLSALKPFKVCVDGSTRVATIEKLSVSRISEIMKKKMRRGE